MHAINLLIFYRNEPPDPRLDACSTEEYAHIYPEKPWSSPSVAGCSREGGGSGEEWWEEIGGYGEGRR